MAKQEVEGCVRIGTHFHWLLSAHIWLLLHETDLMLDGQNTVLALEDLVSLWEETSKRTVQRQCGKCEARDSRHVLGIIVKKKSSLLRLVALGK